MKSIALILAAAIAFSGAAYGQAHSPGSPAAKQDVGDPLIKKPTSEDRARGMTTGSISRKGGSKEQIGGPPESQQSSGSNGG